MILSEPGRDDTMPFAMFNIDPLKNFSPSRRAIVRLLVSTLLAILLPLSNPQAQDKKKTEGAKIHPLAIDLRPAFGAQGLTPLSQGKRGTCSVFVMTQALEFAFAKKEIQTQRFSAEFLNWASNRATNDKEDGGFFSDLWTGFAAYGISLESAMPYREKYDPGLEPSPTAREDAEPRRKAGLELFWIKKWDPNRGLNDDELGRVLETLAAGRPVCGGFLWPKKAVWTKGILESCPRDQVFDGHSLLLVGYRDDAHQPGGGLLLIRNSGGPDRDGCIPYAYAKAYMNDAAWIGVGGISGQGQK
jgi:hypothetical protein